MPGGRPTKYNAKIVADAKHYIENYEEYGDVIPSIVGMACELKINKSTLYDWADDPEKEFSTILAHCMSKQERVLFQKGLTNDFNATIVKLALGKHGYKDQSSNEQTGKGGGPIQLQEMTFIPVGSDD